ncbi:MAG: hypothetical protein ACKORB_01120, partial [Opitutia bacterium]
MLPRLQFLTCDGGAFGHAEQARLALGGADRILLAPDRPDEADAVEAELAGLLRRAGRDAAER